MYYCWCNDNLKINNKSTLIQQIRNLAELGQVTNGAGFGIRSKVEDVIRVLGPMDTFAYLETKWQGYDHLKYNIQNGLINAIISSDPALQGITIQDITQTLGEPTTSIKPTQLYGDHLSYEIPNYKLDFLIPTESNPGTLGHPVVIVSHAY